MSFLLDGDMHHQRGMLSALVVTIAVLAVACTSNEVLPPPTETALPEPSPTSTAIPTPTLPKPDARAYGNSHLRHRRV